jgi:hypothetical protein
MATSQCSKPQEWGISLDPRGIVSKDMYSIEDHVWQGELASSGENMITIEIHEQNGMAAYVMRPNSSARKPTSRVDPLLLSPSKPIK